MKTKNPKIKLLFRDSYLRVIQNSVGSRMFRNFLGLIDGREADLLKNGELSCAYFVCCILRLFDLINKVHLTVNGTIVDMKKFGWYGIKSLRKGCIVLWENQVVGGEQHSHIGFYIGHGKAVSNSSTKRIVT